MKTTTLGRALVPGVAVLAIALSACSAGNDTASEDSGSGGDVPTDLSGELAIGGSSAQQAAQEAWAVGFQGVNPDVTVTYDPVGSGSGRESFIDGTYPVAGSDAYLVDDEEATELSDATERCGGDAPIEVPAYVSPIAIIYNLDGVDTLNLPPEVLAGIFAGEITTWDDPAIAEANPDATLPSDDINAVHRSDESGTTENFTRYLDAVAGDVWTAGEVETWPGEFGGSGAAQTSGVTDSVRSIPLSIGYADASAASDIAQANIGVGEEFVAPSADAAAAILENSPQGEGASDNALVFDLDYNTEEAGVYPITLVSYMIACASYSGDDAEVGALAKGYLQYIVSDDGQTQGSDEAGSAPLSDEIQSQAQELADGIQVG